MIEQTFVMIKPDGVQRGYIGEIISRFEKVGLKVIGLKMLSVDKDFASQHYTEDISKRRGEHVRKYLVDFLQEGPVVAIALEGVGSIEIVRKMVGETEPRKAAPGTIRGDYSHVSYAYADDKKMVVRNIIHASANADDAKAELSLWFGIEELHKYESVHDKHIF
ncbi:MAG: nucleoside-diphosphate kinase [archaeon]